MEKFNKPISEIISRFGNKTAIQSFDKKNLSYFNLKKSIITNSELLYKINLKEKKKFAYVCSPGPEAITIFLTLIESFCAAPLNPNYTTEEFITYLQDLKVDAIIIEEKNFINASRAAKKLKLPIIEYRKSKDNFSGKIDLIKIQSNNKSKKFNKDKKNNFNYLKEKRLILHTSGTTSKPKTIELTQKNIFSSSQNIINSLELGSTDKCLNLMPLFHIHGLIGCVLSTVLSGGTVVASNGFNALNFFSYLKEFRPSWLSAVPTMYQIILKRKKTNKFESHNRIRFVRSSSAPMPNILIKEIESFFDCPLIEAYGMTEASHQITSNKLNKDEYRLNTVGKPQGVKVSILTKNNEIKNKNAFGEILIKGDSVITKYKNNESANNENFYKNWLKTGDQGFIDNEGFLKITGRLKEIINRGGEKISPFEIDEILLNHNNIKEAVSFSFPNKTLGEIIYSAVVLEEDVSSDEKEIKQYLKNHLSTFKIPEKFFFLKEIPKNSTGKIRRLEMPKLLGLK